MSFRIAPDIYPPNFEKKTYTLNLKRKQKLKDPAYMHTSYIKKEYTYIYNKVASVLTNVSDKNMEDGCTGT